MEPSPADALPAELRAAFEALRARFRTGLPERWREIEEAGSAAERAKALHRLAGAAGAYGFGDVGRAALAAERLAERLGEADAGAEAGPALEAALAGLLRVIQETTAP